MKKRGEGKENYLCEEYTLKATEMPGCHGLWIRRQSAKWIESKPQSSARSERREADENRARSPLTVDVERGSSFKKRAEHVLLEHHQGVPRQVDVASVDALEVILKFIFLYESKLCLTH